MSINARHLFTGLALCLSLNVQPSTAFAQGTAFTYQGQLQNNGSPASGTYNLTFSLYTNSTGGVPIAGPVTNNDVIVTNGLFTVTMDFGASAWNGETNWLEIGVEINGAGSFTTLAPRQELTPAPYAIYAEGANAAGITGTLPAGDFSGAYGNAVNFNNASNSFNGSFSGNGGSLTNVNAATVGGLAAANFWQTTGNAGTSPTNGNFLGTTDNQPLALHANGQRILQLLPDTSANDAPDIIGGSPTNTMTSGLVGATISGGAANTIGLSSLFSTNNPYGDTGAYPAIGASFSTIGGGFLNEIQTNATFSTVVGGALNTIQAGAVESTIGGGFSNTVLLNGSWSTIAGGTHHTIDADNGFIGGGWNNTIQLDASYSAIVGGEFNTVQSLAGNSIIGGGDDNTIDVDAPYSMIGGGLFNQISGDTNFYGTSVIVGGYACQIYNNSWNSIIGGGGNNTIGSNSDHSVIVGGVGNTVSGKGSFIGGGGYDGITYSGNVIEGNAAVIGGGLGNATTNGYATVAGGAYNSTTDGYGTVSGGSYNSSGFESVVAGGTGNNDLGSQSAIGGGQNNLIQIEADHAFIGGGQSNNIVGSASLPVYAVIGGGYGNVVQTNTSYATIPGGYSNSVAGQYGFAAGNQAQANQAGAFVWADSQNAAFASTTSNQFSVRAGGGVRFVTSGAGMTLDGQAVVPSGNYVFAYSTALQPVTTPSTFQDATFNNDARLNGWTHSPGSSQYFCAQTGLYLIQYTAEAYIADSMSMRGALNEVEIPGSQAYASPVNFGPTVVISKNFLASANAGNFLTIQFTGNSSSDHLQGGGSGTVQPSLSLTITRIQ